MSPVDGFCWELLKEGCWLDVQCYDSWRQCSWMQARFCLWCCVQLPCCRLMQFMYFSCCPYIAAECCSEFHSAVAKLLLLMPLSFINRDLHFILHTSLLKAVAAGFMCWPVRWPFCCMCMVLRLVESSYVIVVDAFAWGGYWDCLAKELCCRSVVPVVRWHAVAGMQMSMVAIGFKASVLLWILWIRELTDFESVHV
ncbi:hypothetical protein Nepgr_006729 [Nepenthes gracilis]|uniref:Uncharacterized protein n=1 Tax=Nepenthes gracilis TaxID=150966 RepID=A0AAD3XHM5_NEPGR|nr:hypothetical protein Nepgr_006729 [Nepenthes gracilis]